MPASDGTFVRALLLALALACVPHPLQAAEPAPGAGPSTPTAAHAGASVTPTLHDIVADLGRTSAMLRQFAATLRDTADWNVLASHLEDPAVTSSLRALEEGRDTLSRARYMELIDADTRIRERVRAVNDATDELGRLTRKVEEDLDDPRSRGGALAGASEAGARARSAGGNSAPGRGGQPRDRGDTGSIAGAPRPAARRVRARGCAADAPGRGARHDCGTPGADQRRARAPSKTSRSGGRGPSPFRGTK